MPSPSSALARATALLGSSPLRFPVDFSNAADKSADGEPVSVATQLEKELELAIRREQSAGGSASSSHSKERKNFATLNNGVYYWSLPFVLLEYLHKNDPALGERTVEAQQAYARFKTYGGAPGPSPADVETVMSFGSRLQDVYYSLENVSSFLEVHLPVLKDLLESTVALYKEAHDLGIGANSSNATLGKILFSWAVVLGDLARLAGSGGNSGGAGGNEEQLEYAVASCLKYSGVVSMQEDNVQALNNWGLVICDLANYYGNDGATTTRKQLYGLAMSRFRQALRRSQDSGVDRKVLARCSYNMGSVMYQYCSIIDGEGGAARSDKAMGEVQVAHAAQYVLLAFALNPASEVFHKAIKTIQPFLPLPFLRSSKLVYVYDETNETADQMQQWRPRSLALDAYHLRTVEVNSSEVTDMEINVQDITSSSICVDPWIPGGIGLKLRYRGSRHGVYISSQSREDMQGLLDALNILQVCSSSGLQALADALQRRTS